jgi:hypothetical protein
MCVADFGDALKPRPSRGVGARLARSDYYILSSIGAFERRAGLADAGGERQDLSPTRAFLPGTIERFDFRFEKPTPRIYVEYRKISLSSATSILILLLRRNKSMTSLKGGSGGKPEKGHMETPVGTNMASNYV